MAKVEFKRVETDAEIEDIDIKDGQLIYSKSGKTYMDYGNERIPTGSGGEGGSTEVYIQDTEPTEEDAKIWIDTGEVQNRGSEITNSYSTSTGLGYSANYVNNLVGWTLVDTATGTTSISLNNIDYNELYIIGKAKNDASDNGIWIDFYVLKDILLSSAVAMRKGYYYDASTNGMVFINISNSAVELNNATRNGNDKTSVSQIVVYYR